MTEPKSLENWLYEKAGPAYDALKADPARAATPDQVRYTLAELLAEAEAAGGYPLPPEQREWVDAPAVGREWPACDALEADQVRARLHDDAMVETFRKDPAYAVELLNSILEDGDKGELLIALRQMTKAAGREMLTPFDPAKWLTSTETVAAFLAEAEATGDQAYVEHARAVAARAKVMHGIE
ncbi:MULTISPECIES: hypothetical protein [Pseudomonadota]|jgi:DNA-binding phage protein|uniref:Predicted transcriptional regulator n=2 Tax=Pseudomonadota TaxID=1224 RepID=A0AA35GJD0_9BURK|nr:MULTISPECIES: hypothetical protein [Pseudomonadota]CAB5688781.1 Predicted transcriptional regulator [Comamonas aquatica]ALY65430.1 hypothetical protein HW05_11065 [Pseudomonas aeruginosa]ETD44106.1 hypothetical protein X922_20700 [Pseudomonas aeruginosa VRFPA08]MCM8601297.1 hypothetical protein [Pseudomonas aeruginosa]MCM8642615.1 hypothetical protein [Pseudomonas aeruginosa]